MHFSATQLLSPLKELHSDLHTSAVFVQNHCSRGWGTEAQCHTKMFTSLQRLRLRLPYRTSKQAGSRKPEVRLYTSVLPSPTPFPVKGTAPHLWIIGTEFINGTKLDQLLIDAAKEKQEVRTQPGRLKGTEVFQMCQQSLSPLHTTKWNENLGSYTCYDGCDTSLPTVFPTPQKHLPAPRTVSSSKVLHPKPSHLKSNQHTNSGCCFTKHKEEFYCFSHKIEKGNLSAVVLYIQDPSTTIPTQKKILQILSVVLWSHEKMVAHLGLRNSFFLWMM